MDISNSVFRTSASSQGSAKVTTAAENALQTPQNMQQSTTAAAQDTSQTAADGFAVSPTASSGASVTYSRKEASKGLQASQVQDLVSQQADSYSAMVSEMLTTQLFQTKNADGLSLGDVLSSALESNDTALKDVLSTFQLSDADRQTAADAVSADGEWGVDAVATRIMDMAVALSGGDATKYEELKSAVMQGFSNAASKWGVDDISDMPSITSDTYTEVMNRFDYLEANGTMDGYGDSTTASET